jgi:hypothetical protein
MTILDSIELKLIKHKPLSDEEKTIAKKMLSKKCNGCEKTKPLGKFTPYTRGRLGHRSECKDCLAERARKLYHKNLERGRAYANQYYYKRKEQKKKEEENENDE